MRMHAHPPPVAEPVQTAKPVAQGHLRTSRAEVMDMSACGEVLAPGAVRAKAAVNTGYADLITAARRPAPVLSRRVHDASREGGHDKREGEISAQRMTRPVQAKATVFTGYEDLIKTAGERSATGTRVPAGRAVQRKCDACDKEEKDTTARLAVTPVSKHGEGGPEEEPGTLASEGDPPTNNGGTQVIQQQNGGTSTSVPRLRKTTVSGPTMGDCAAYSWGVQWSLDNATSSTNGFIVQRVDKAFNATVCPGPIDVKIHTGGLQDPAWYPFWEAWQVRGGNIFVGTTSTSHSADTYATPTFGTGSQGSIAVTATAQYYDGVTSLPSGFVARGAPPAWALPYTKTDPALSGGTGSIPHNISVTWDCCPQTSTTNATQLVSTA